MGSKEQKLGYKTAMNTTKRLVRSGFDSVIAGARQLDELTNLVNMPDSEIDTSDIPVVTDWSKAERGKFYRVSPEREKEMVAWVVERVNESLMNNETDEDVSKEIISRILNWEGATK